MIDAAQLALWPEHAPAWQALVEAWQSDIAEPRAASVVAGLAPHGAGLESTWPSARDTRSEHEAQS